MLYSSWAFCFYRMNINHTTWVMDPESVFLSHESQVSSLERQDQDNQYTTFSLVLVITSGSRDTGMNRTLLSIFFHFFFFLLQKGRGCWFLIYYKTIFMVWIYQPFYLHLFEVLFSKGNHFGRCRNSRSLKVSTKGSFKKLEFKQIATNISWKFFSPVTFK